MASLIGRNVFRRARPLLWNTTAAANSFKMVPPVKLQKRYQTRVDVSSEPLSFVPRIPKSEAKGVTAGNIMKATGSCVHILHTRTVKDAVVKMSKHGVGSVIVVSHDHKVVGIVTERDVLLKAEIDSKPYHKKLVSDIMTKDPVCSTRDHDLNEVISYMLESNTRHVPVVDFHETDQFDYKPVAQESLIGMISVKDIVARLHRLSLKDDQEKNEYLSKKVGDIGTGTACYSIGETASVLDGVKLMTDLNIGALLVGFPKPSGIFTERDYMKFLAHDKSSKDTAISVVMTKEMKVVSPDSNLEECLSALFEGGFRHLPVYSDTGNCQTILSIRDILRAYCA